MVTLRNKVILEWSYEPPGIFEEPQNILIGDHEIRFSDGKAETIFDSNVLDKNQELPVHLQNKMDLYFLGLRVARHDSHSLSRCTIIRFDEAGNRHSVVPTTPVQAKLTLKWLNLKITNAKGEVIVDTRAQREKSDREFAELVSKYYEEDETCKSVNDSYVESIDDPDDELIHLYEIRDTLKSKFGGQREARQVLRISKDKWNRLGELANKLPLRESRHRGSHVGNLKSASKEELNEARNLAKTMIKAYLDHMENLNLDGDQEND